MTSLRVFWEFTRPHTIIGSAISIAVLAVLALNPSHLWSVPFVLVLTSGLACNVFITGYNQIVDVQLDRRNKPELPLASGAMRMQTARIIVWLSLAISLGIAAWLSSFLLGLVGLIAALGFAYSWKAVFLKKRHGTAAMAITLVRGILINLGFFMYFSGRRDLSSIPNEIWLLTAFISLFSLGIAWFKDIPDMAGDAEAAIDTLAVKAGASKAFRLGSITVGCAYLIGAIGPLVITTQGYHAWVLALGHMVLGTVFVSFTAKTNPESQVQIKRFYKLFWVLFFAEYSLFLLAEVLG
jgi:homogentisate phytyltransferase/homogentisate geranylgeranyltransferase